jgi:predicted nucleic acid-binding protein
MKTLVDTCVWSELKLPAPNPLVVSSIRQVEQGDLQVSVISMGELQKGISFLPLGRKRAELDTWFNGIQVRFAEQIVDIDLETSLIWGELSARIRLSGNTIGDADLLIAASALRHGFRVMTRNIRDFTPTGVLLVNPWQDDISQ